MLTLALFVYLQSRAQLINMTTGGFSLSNQDKEFSNNVWKPSIISEDSVGSTPTGLSLFGKKHTGFSFGGGATLDYMWYDKRLESFTYWPKHHPMRPESLSGAGFYYTGFSDKVRCFSCEPTLQQWEVFDCALEQHKKHSNGNCNFFKIYFPSKCLQ